MEHIPASRLLTCWLRPATNAPRLTHLKLRWAYLIHILAGLAFFVGLLAFVQIGISRASGRQNAIVELALEVGSHWQEAALVTSLTVAGIEAGFVFLALILLPWAAADERLRSSWAHALRFTWLHTTHALALLLVMGPIFVGLADIRRSYYRTHPPPRWDIQYPSYPTTPPNALPGSQAMKDYEAAVAQHQQAVQDLHNTWRSKYQSWRRTQPFLVQHGEAIIGWLYAAGSAWFLWALFRAAGTPRSLPIGERPPTCEFCGYNLTGTAIESRCPECGTPAIESLGSHVRAGTDWDRDGGLRGLWHSGMEAVFRPGRLGHQIQVTTQPRRFRSLCWALILPAGLIGAAAVPVCYALISHQNPLTHDIEVITIGLPLTAASSGVGMFLLAMLIASIVGMIQTWQNKRNLLPAAAQTASYLHPVFTAWGLFGAMWFALFSVVVQSSWFNNSMMTLGGTAVLLAFASLFAPHLAWLVISIVLTWKGTAAARYANK